MFQPWDPFEAVVLAEAARLRWATAWLSVVARRLGRAGCVVATAAHVDQRANGRISAAAGVHFSGSSQLPGAGVGGHKWWTYGLVSKGR